MAPKKNDGAAAPKAKATHASYQVCLTPAPVGVLLTAHLYTDSLQDMITEGIVTVNTHPLAYATSSHAVVVVRPKAGLP